MTDLEQGMYAFRQYRKATWEGPEIPGVYFSEYECTNLDTPAKPFEIMEMLRVMFYADDWSFDDVPVFGPHIPADWSINSIPPSKPRNDPFQLKLGQHTNGKKRRFR